MLKKSTFAILFLTLALPLNVSAQDKDGGTTTTEKKYKLEYKFVAKKVDKYRIRIAAKTSGMMALEMKGIMQMEQTGRSFDSDKKLGQVVQDVKSIKLGLDMAGQKQEYDTEKGGGAEGNLLKNAAEQIVGKTTLDIKATGKVEKSKRDKKEGNNPLKAALGAQHIPYDIIRFPAKEIKVGDTWSHSAEQKSKDSMGQETVIKIKYSYTLKRVQINKVGDEIATIILKIKPDLKVMPGGMGGKVTKTGGKGTASFNISKGHLRSCNYTVKIEGKSEFGEGDDAKMFSKQSFNLRRTNKAKKEEK
jgi:hypothetical protein